MRYKKPQFKENPKSRQIYERKKYTDNVESKREIEKKVKE